jgi:uncharacterized membrane protein YfhO
MGRIEVALADPAPSDGWVVVRESNDPGWVAVSESGRPLRLAPAQVRFLAVEAPAGTRRVALRYVPPHWGVAWGLAGAPLAAIVTGAFWARRGGTARPGPRLP